VGGGPPLDPLPTGHCLLTTGHEPLATNHPDCQRTTRARSAPYEKYAASLADSYAEDRRKHGISHGWPRMKHGWGGGNGSTADDPLAADDQPASNVALYRGGVSPGYRVSGWIDSRSTTSFCSYPPGLLFPGGNLDVSIIRYDVPRNLVGMMSPEI
jgi:hypothetical protein